MPIPAASGLLCVGTRCSPARNSRDGLSTEMHCTGTDSTGSHATIIRPRLIAREFGGAFWRAALRVSLKTGKASSGQKQTRQRRPTSRPFSLAAPSVTDTLKPSVRASRAASSARRSRHTLNSACPLALIAPSVSISPCNKARRCSRDAQK